MPTSLRVEWLSANEWTFQGYELRRKLPRRKSAHIEIGRQNQLTEADCPNFGLAVACESVRTDAAH
jgi:hypothetical protein